MSTISRDAADRFQNASDDPETFKVLEKSKFRELYPRWALHTEEDPSEVFDQGGRLPVNW